MKTNLPVRVGIIALACLCAMIERSAAQEPQDRVEYAAAVPGGPESGPPIELSKELPGLVRLAKDSDVWIDAKRKLIVAEGQVCLRRGMLEMFACPRQTKEHESIVAVNAAPSVVHAGLLAIGAKSGKPVQFRPAYKPPTGTKIAIWVLWRDKEGQPQKVRAQEWVRNLKTKETMQLDWVFAGSGFFKDEQTGEARYQGDSGDFVCVSNFPTATLDIPVESSQSNEELLFEANTERIPTKGTRVRLVFIPELSAGAQDPEKDGDPRTSDSQPLDSQSTNSQSTNSHSTNSKAANSKASDTSDSNTSVTNPHAAP